MPRPQKVFPGQQYSQLTVIAEVEERKNSHRHFLCRCDCGETTIVSGDSLRRGTTKKCRNRSSDLHLAERFWALVDIRNENECWPWLGTKSKKGYGKITYNGKPKKATHVLIYLTTGDWIEPGLCTCHHCDNPSCVNPAHIFIGTNADNVADMISKGRKAWAVGENVGSSKLTKQDVLEIRYLREVEKWKYRELSEKFGVSTSSIRSIVIGNAWKHV